MLEHGYDSDYEFTCDACEEVLEIEDEGQSWGEVLEALKEANWTWKSDGRGGYKHACPDCQ